MTYDIVYADPAWKFASNSAAKPSKNAMRHYDVMTDAEICAIPVKEWVGRDALLLMWTTAPMLARSMPVLGAWGFKYVSQVVWVKPRIATGYWARNRHEVLIIAKRGKFPCPKPTLFPDSVITAPTREHSRKPDCVRDRIAQVFPDHRKIELNARETFEGWDTWGNEVDKFPKTAFV
jgi:N6-adenosine-specific RNA methylase IME4